jgi:hypothetical protein
MLPQDILDALSQGKISEGHTRPLLMLIDKPAEQITLFKEMLMRKMTVREAEGLARRVAFEKIRKKDLYMNPEIIDNEEKLAESLGTRVHIEPKEKGGKIVIDYFSHEEFLQLANIIKRAGENRTHKGIFEIMKEEVNLNIQNQNSTLANAFAGTGIMKETLSNLPSYQTENILPTSVINKYELEKIDYENHTGEILNTENQNEKLEDDRSKEEINRDENTDDINLYDIKNFSL